MTIELKGPIFKPENGNIEIINLLVNKGLNINYQSHSKTNAWARENRPWGH